MYMIWLVTVLNGQQRPVAIPAILVLTGEAITATAATTSRAFARAAVRAIVVTTSLSGHFYTCRTEC